MRALKSHLALLVLAVVSEACTGTEEVRIVQPGQLFPQGGISGDEYGLELVDRLGAGLDCRPFGEFVHPGDLHGSVA
ncbi:hypothetical protein [Streptomyces nigrescens]|uniref:hypothetical protein n=1 Tax=Streptomyces nigrescens TaxID=1920 RepID=UPI00135AECE3|nr:hypothetical protein [Streptomyces libani]